MKRKGRKREECEIEMDLQGFKGGQGRSNQEIYETGEIMFWAVLGFMILTVTSAVVIVTVKFIEAVR